MHEFNGTDLWTPPERPVYGPESAGGSNEQPNLRWLYLMARRFARPLYAQSFDGIAISPSKMQAFFESNSSEATAAALQMAEWIRQELTAEQIEALVIQEVRTYWSDWKQEYARTQDASKRPPRRSAAPLSALEESLLKDIEI